MSVSAQISELDPRRQELVRRRLEDAKLAGVPRGPRRRLTKALLDARIGEVSIIPFPASAHQVERAESPVGLTNRWYGLRHHVEQYRLLKSEIRFRVVPAGRRSGKTEIGKRYLVGTAVCAHSEARFFAAAPTWQQAKKIWWADLKALSPPHMVADKSDGELWIKYTNGAEIHVVGTDVAARIEGTPWDGGILDEYGNMRAEVWEEHLRPVMAERMGWCWFIGVPEGRNHYYKLYRVAQAQAQARAYLVAGRLDEAKAVMRSAYSQEKDADELIAEGLGALEWDTFSWVSADILNASEIASARRAMPADLFEQEFEARFTSFRGRVYASFRSDSHAAPLAHRYNPREPLILCLDFNVAPGVAAVIQEMNLPSGHYGSAVIGEVHIPHDSTTELVCRTFREDWEGHQGPLIVYGDATGGQRKTQHSESGGTDWRIVERSLRSTFPRVVMRVPSSNPPEKDRVNNVNARLKSASGDIRLMVDPMRAPNVVEDFEGVRWLEGSNEIAKSGKQNLGLTHLTDAIGYYVSEQHPIPDFSASGIKRHRYSVG